MRTELTSLLPYAKSCVFCFDRAGAHGVGSPDSSKGTELRRLAHFRALAEWRISHRCFRAKALVRIVRIPLEGRAAIQELVTVTSDVWGITADPDGSVLVNLVDRPAELVRFTARGGQPLKIASFPNLHRWIWWWRSRMAAP